MVGTSTFLVIHFLKLLLHASCPTTLSLAIMDRLAVPHVACKMQPNIHPSTDSCIGYLFSLFKQLFPYCGYTSPRVRVEGLSHVSLLVDPRNNTIVNLGKAVLQPQLAEKTAWSPMLIQVNFLSNTRSSLKSRCSCAHTSA